VEEFRRGTNAISPVEILQWKLKILGETWSIAVGPNAIANIVDMALVITLTRMSFENYWIPEEYGDSALPMLKINQAGEREIWRLAEEALSPKCLEQLRQAIQEMSDQHPNPRETFYFRAPNLPSAVRTLSGDANNPNLFSFLKLDPFAGLDPATRQLEETRLFAERALFTAQHMAMIVRLQGELLANQTVDLPEVQQMVTNTTQLAGAADRFSRVAQALPGQISEEREKIVQAVQSQTPGLTSLAAETKETLTAGATMASNLNLALTTFDNVVSNLNASPPDPNASPSPPFRIEEYTAAAAQIDATAQRLTTLLQQFDRTLGSTNIAKLTAEIAPVVTQAQTGGKELVDYAFRKGILFVVICCGAVFTTALVYRRVAGARREKPDGRKSE
jgi:hypothetical protein